MDLKFRSDTLPLILIAAVAQGWALYGLQLSINSNHWPATDQRWLSAFYVLAAVIPVTLQLLADYRRRPALWLIVGLLTSALFWFGWCFGDLVQGSSAELRKGQNETLFLVIELGILWLIVLPFIQSRLATGRWSVEYRALFTNAWRNKISLAEAALFTGIFWLLLELWQALFHMLDMNFFRTLFAEPIFVYPVTALAFGLALYLVGSIDPLLSAVLEQILSVLKWLAVLTGVLLVLFTAALTTKLPELVFEGQKAIGASWLLWLIAVVVLFLNAAYRDGTVAQPYPGWIGRSFRWIVPLTIVIALTAAYAIGTRERHYGLTVERYWAIVVAVAALLYAVGYSWAAVDRAAWFTGIARVNVTMALVLAAVLAMALTPLGSPYRLAADSQVRRILDGKLESVDGPVARQTSFHYLRWDAGEYGHRRLQELSELQNNPNAGRIRELAAAALKEENRWWFAPKWNTKSLLAALPIFPEGRSIDAGLLTVLLEDVNNPEDSELFGPGDDNALGGLYLDLKGDGAEQFVLLNCCQGLVYEHFERGWVRIGRISGDGRAISRSALEAALRTGQVKTQEPAWRELLVGGRAFRMNRSERALNDGH